MLKGQRGWLFLSGPLYLMMRMAFSAIHSSPSANLVPDAGTHRFAERPLWNSLSEES